ncbi:hypothetical protein TRAPUB_12527 [Trametes pubescens]|uniref:Uncharacterized protein n=1 Tax=Trametes pubescens TaxID=154538 RepID=A0A1M2VRD5_TRAPU|nr:hypothetical protein TRAPUB_13386 [Trametes pubescens]OJT10132.1 hypothetical protein TRAPUB_13382 [Trametes pubescens]OJT10965.1 hypothetical protein TRAPUB_12527 [Trametes pubescens]
MDNAVSRDLASMQHVLTPPRDYQFIPTPYSTLSTTQPSQPTVSCQEPGCRSAQKPASDCARKRCKKHCLDYPTPCGFKAHDQTRRALAAAPVPPTQTPFTLSHPAPVIPPRPRQFTPSQPILDPQVSVATQLEDLGSSSHIQRDVMPEEMKQDWDTAMRERLEKTRAVAERRHNLLMVERTFNVNAWTVDGQHAIESVVQGPPTWPTVKLAQLRIIRDLGLQDETTVQQFVLSTRSWVNIPLTYKIKVRPKEHILIRRIGVQNCPDFEDVCA